MAHMKHDCLFGKHIEKEDNTMFSTLTGLTSKKENGLISVHADYLEALPY